MAMLLQLGNFLIQKKFTAVQNLKTIMLVQKY